MGLMRIVPEMIRESQRPPRRGQRGPPKRTLEIAEFYRVGGAAGVTPQEIGRMSVWQFTAFTEGFVNFHSPPDKTADAPTDEEFEEFVMSQKLAALN